MTVIGLEDSDIFRDTSRLMFLCPHYLRALMGRFPLSYPRDHNLVLKKDVFVLIEYIAILSDY